MGAEFIPGGVPGDGHTVTIMGEGDWVVPDKGNDDPFAGMGVQDLSPAEQAALEAGIKEEVYREAGL